MKILQLLRDRPVHGGGQEALLKLLGIGPLLPRCEIGQAQAHPSLLRQRLSGAQALTRLRPRIAVPIHWGALRYIGPQAIWNRVDYLSSPPVALICSSASTSASIIDRSLTAIGPVSE